jgi:hypothetical protein
MTDWRKQLRCDPLPALLNSSNKAIVYFTRRDLLNEQVEPIDSVWELPEPQKILRKQQADGSWKLEAEKAGKPKDLVERQWLGLAVGRILQTYFG